MAMFVGGVGGWVLGCWGCWGVDGGEMVGVISECCDLLLFVLSDQKDLGLRRSVTKSVIISVRSRSACMVG